MVKSHVEEAKKMFERGHTFYGIAYQLEQWFHKNYTEAQIQKALGGVENNPAHRKKTQ